MKKENLKQRNNLEMEDFIDMYNNKNVNVLKAAFDKC